MAQTTLVISVDGSFPRVFSPFLIDKIIYIFMMYDNPVVHFEMCIHCRMRESS